MPTSATALQPLDVGACFNEAVEIYKRNWFVLVAASALFSALSLCSLLILTGPLVAGWCHLLLRARERPDRKARLGDLFGAMQPFGLHVGLFFTLLGIHALSFLCLVLPVLIASTFVMYAFPICYDRKLGIVESIEVSFRAVQKHGVGNHLLLNVITLAFALGGNLIPIFGLQFLVSCFLMPFAWLAWIEAYIRTARQDQIQGVPGDFLDPAANPQLSHASPPPPPHGSPEE